MGRSSPHIHGVKSIHLSAVIAPKDHSTSNVAAPTQSSYARLDAGYPISLPPSDVPFSPSPAPSLPLSGFSTAPASPEIALVAATTVAGVVSLAVAASVISAVSSKMGVALLPCAWSLLSAFTSKLRSLTSLSRFKSNGGDPADEEGDNGVYDRRAVLDTLIKQGEEILSTEYKSSIENLTKMSMYEASKFLKEHGVIVPELEEVCAKSPAIEKIDDDQSITMVKELAVATPHISDEADADMASATISCTVESTNMDALKSRMAMSAKSPAIEKIDDDQSIMMVKELAVATPHISDEGDADTAAATISRTVEPTNMNALKSRMAMSDKGVVITDGGSYSVTSGGMLSSTSEQVARPHAAGNNKNKKRALMTQEPISRSSAGVAKRPTRLGHVSISCEISAHRLRYYFLCNSGATYDNHSSMGSTPVTQFYHPQQQPQQHSNVPYASHNTPDNAMILDMNQLYHPQQQQQPQQHSNVPYASHNTPDTNAMILDMNQLYHPQQQSLPWPLSHKTQDTNTSHNPTHNNQQGDGLKPTSQPTPPHGLLSKENPIQEYGSPFYGV